MVAALARSHTLHHPPSSPPPFPSRAPQLRTFRRDAAMVTKTNDLLAFYVAEHVKPEESAAVRAAGASGSLTPIQRADIAVAAEAGARSEAALAKAAAVDALVKLQAVAAQAGLRLQAVRQTAHDFKQTVIQGGVNAQTGKVTAEAVVRFFEESLRKRRTALEKLESKTTALSTQLAAVKTRDGRAAASSSDLLKYIVFHQLKIEISQAQATLLEKSKELLSMKLNWGVTSNLVAQLKRACARARHFSRRAFNSPPLPPPPPLPPFRFFFYARRGPGNVVGRSFHCKSHPGGAPAVGAAAAGVKGGAQHAAFGGARRAGAQRAARAGRQNYAHHA